MNSHRLMPDFVEALETRLRAEAVSRNRSRSIHQAPRLGGRAIAITAAGVVAACLVAVAIVPTHAERAFGSPPAILKMPALDVREDAQASAAATTTHSSAELRRAWSTPAFGGTAYLLQGDNTWCLSAPDPASTQPDVERGYTCTDDGEFARIGISLTIGNNYLAVVRGGAPAPTLRTLDGITTNVRPSPLGVIVLPDLAPGTVITIHGPHGDDRAERIQTPPTNGRKGTCANGITFSAPAGQDDPCSGIQHTEGGGR